MDPFIGQISMLAFNFAPSNWSFCDGQLIAIDNHAALYSLLSTHFGGNGRSDFALPDLRGRVPVGQGLSEVLPYAGGYTVGSRGGYEEVVLTEAELPTHDHLLHISNAQTSVKKYEGNSFAVAKDAVEQPVAQYTTLSQMVTLNAATVLPAGSGLPHENMQPSLVVNFCIAMQGQYPSRN